MLLKITSSKVELNAVRTREVYHAALGRITLCDKDLLGKPIRVVFLFIMKTPGVQDVADTAIIYTAQEPVAARVQLLSMALPDRDNLKKKHKIQ